VSAPSSNNSDSKFLQRLERAKTHDLILDCVYITKNNIVCQVVGTTKNIYVVRLVGSPTCTCMDFENNGNRCKHILFMLHKKLKIDDIKKSTYHYMDIKNAISSSCLARSVPVIVDKN
jgi:hypothetical protein